MIGFPSNKTSEIVKGGSSVGGLCGEFKNPKNFTSISIFQSGVVQGKISSNLGNTGSIIGSLIIDSVSNDIFISQVYSGKDVQVSCGGDSCGGFIGLINVQNHTVLIENSYSRSNVTSTSFSVGGLIGNISTSISLNISNSYTSNSVNGLNKLGASIGDFSGNLTLFSSNYFFNNETNLSLAAVGVANFSTNITGLSCFNLYNQLENFNQSVWGGNELRFQFNFTSVPDICIFPPSTLPPSTNSPSTNLPSTLEPTTNTPSTSTPSTNTPSTNIPSTNTPSTITPSTSNPSTNSPSSSLPSTIPPTTSPSNNSCFYNVPNCEKCPIFSIQVDQTQYNISCIFDGNNWLYSFKNKFSNDFTLSNNVSFDKNINNTVIIDGNFIQSSTSTISVFFSFPKSSKKSIPNQNSIFNISGCVSLDGNLELVLEERPSKNENITVNLISYQCPQKTNLADSQIKLTTNYKDNNCDFYSKNLKNEPNTLSVSISSTLNQNCKGNFFIFISFNSEIF